MKKVSDFSTNPGLLCHNSTEENSLELPGQVCVPASRHLRNDFTMNSPGDVGGHGSAFSGMYESDSNYRWRKVKGNLDLFVMERNERHLTSLQWKWQKMSKPRRRTPVYEEYANDSPGDDVYKQMPESARTRSRAKSRQRMREDLDAFFYDRWKNADNKQKKSDNKTQKIKDEETYYNSLKDEKPQNEFNYQHRGGAGDPSKWSRYGCTPNFPNPFSNFPPGYYNTPFSNQDPMGLGPNSRSPNDHHDSYRQAEYIGSHSPRGKYSERLQQNPQNRFHDEYNSAYYRENQEENDGYWRSRSRYPPNTYSPREQSYRNYGYAPDYSESNGFAAMHDNQHSHGFPTQFHSSAMNKPMYHNYGFSRPPNHEPWVKKQHPSKYRQDNGQFPGDTNTYKTDEDRKFISHMDEENNADSPQESSRSPVKVDETDRCVSRQSDSRVGFGLEMSLSGQPCNTTKDHNDQTQRQKTSKLNFRGNPPSEENSGDDDVFHSSASSFNQKIKANDDALSRRQAQENEMKKVEDGTTVDDRKGAERLGMSHQDESPEQRNNFGYHLNSPKDVNLPNHSVVSSLYYYNSSRRRKSSGANDAEMDAQTVSALMGHMPTNPAKLPPLQAEHVASVRSLKNKSSHSMKSSNSLRSDCGNHEKNASYPKKNLDDSNNVMPLRKPEFLHSADSNNVSTCGFKPANTSNGINTLVDSPENIGLSPSKPSPQHRIEESGNNEVRKTSQRYRSLPDTQEASYLSKQEREATTIHVGDIDAASPTPTTSMDSKNQAAFGKDSSNSDQIKKVAALVVEKSNPDQNTSFDAFLKPDQSPHPKTSLTKSKTTLWKLAKNLQRRMATKLSLRREKSKLISISTETKSVRTSRSSLSSTSSQKINGNIINQNVIKPEQTSETFQLRDENVSSPCEAQVEVAVNNVENQNTASSKPDVNVIVVQPIVQRKTNERTPSPESAKHSQVHATESTQSKYFPTTSESEVNGKKSKKKVDEDIAEKHFFEEEMKLEEKRKKNEALTNQLLKDQHEMEFELHNLRKMLNAEMRRQEDNNCVNDRFNKKIEDIEKQIEQLDEKLSETTDKIKQNEMEKEAITNRMTCGGGGSILPPNPPLFIISDPHDGTAAALTQGSYLYDSLSSSTPNQHRVAPFFNRPPCSSSELSPYSIRRNSIDTTLKQQEQLKADLETQMAAMKEELQKQLDEQRTQTGLESKNIIDARVANLEEQIEEMKQKIESAESSIKYAEMKKHQEKITHKDSHIKHEQTNDIAENNKYLKPKLSLSPKVTPAQLRKHVEEKLDDFPPKVDHCEREKRFFKEENNSDVIGLHSDESQSDDDVMIIAEKSFTKDSCSSMTSGSAQEVRTNSLKSRESYFDSNSPTQSPVTSSKILKQKQDSDVTMNFDKRRHENSIDMDCCTSQAKVTLNAELEQNKNETNKKGQNQNDTSEKKQNKNDLSGENDTDHIERSKIFGDDSSAFEETIVRNVALTSDYTNRCEDKLIDFDEERSQIESVITSNETATVVEDLETAFKNDEKIKFSSTGRSSADSDKVDAGSDKTNPGRSPDVDKNIQHESVEPKDENGSFVISSNEHYETSPASEIPTTVELKQNKSVGNLLPDHEKTSGNNCDDIIHRNDVSNGAVAVVSTELYSQKSVQPTKDLANVDDIKEIDNLGQNLTSEVFESIPLSLKNVEQKIKLLNETAKPKSQLADVEAETKPGSSKPIDATVVKSKIASLDFNDKTKSKKETEPVSFKSSTFLTKSSSANAKAISFTSKYSIINKTATREPSSFLERYKQKRQFSFMVTKPLKEKPRTIDKTIQPQNDETKTSKVSQPTKPSWSSMFSFKFKPLPKKISISETPSKKEKPKPKTENRKTIPKRASFTSSIKVPEIFSTKQKKTENPKKETNTSTKSDLPKSEVEETDENKQTKDKEKKASTKFFSSFRKSKRPPDLKLEQLSPAKSRKDFKLQPSQSEQETSQSSSNTYKKRSFKTSSFSFHKPRSNVPSQSSTSNLTSAVSSSQGEPSTYVKSTNKTSNPSHQAITMTSMESEFSQVYEDISQTEASTTHTASTRKAGRGWDLPKPTRCRSLFYGMGTSWCVCPEKIWKYLGHENDDETITRRKCISLIMGAILAVLLLAVVIGLIIGLAFSEGPTESPIRFVVIPGEDDT